MTNKEWYKSKTIWSCAAALVVAVASAVLGETNTYTAGLVALFSVTGIYGRSVANTNVK